MSNKKIYQGHRNSYMGLKEVYFWTATIKDWIPLLQTDVYKEVVMKSLQWLCKNKLIRLYGYVVMPNHVHIMWEQLKMNGKEFPKNSFQKFTANQYKKKLINENPDLLEKFRVPSNDREYNFWQRDALAVSVISREMAAQKLDYMHFNPLQEHWQICREPEAYRFSSASFYEGKKDEFGILTHYMDIF